MTADVVAAAEDLGSVTEDPGLCEPLEMAQQNTGGAARKPRARRADGEATRARVLHAALESIVEKGYYQTSSNEIARRAGVTWGTIQHQFGTREALLLEVIKDHWSQLANHVATADVTGRTLEQRIESLLDILSVHYSQPEDLALIQILLNLYGDPESTAPTREAIHDYGARLHLAWTPLFTQAFGDAASDDDVIRFAFLMLRGYLTADLLAVNMGGEGATPIQRKMLVDGVAHAIRGYSREHQLSLRRSS